MELSNNETFDLVETKNIPTELEMRRLRKQYVTIQLPTVQACGHKFAGEPKNNCQFCWFAFFNHFGEMTQTAEKLFSEHGEQALIALRGAKFTKNFKKFMATLAVWKAEQERINGESRSSDSSTTGESGEVQATPIS